MSEPATYIRKRYEAAQAIFEAAGMDFRAPWQCSLDDGERERYEALLLIVRKLSEFGEPIEPEEFRELYERGFHGHGTGTVVTQPEPGRFEERPMTVSELAARSPAMRIALQIHKLACYAAFAYVECWEIIAPAIEAAIEAERDQKFKLDAALRAKDGAMNVLFKRLRDNGIDYSDLIS